MKKITILDGILSRRDLTEKARRIIESSDKRATEDIFCGCKTVEDINDVAEEMYDEIFEEE